MNEFINLPAHVSSGLSSDCKTPDTFLTFGFDQYGGTAL
jgi:hypothetical protein